MRLTACAPPALRPSSSHSRLPRCPPRPRPMNRFRPNLVVGGSAAYAEDDWGDVRIGNAKLRGVKPCGRCEVTTTDQSTGDVRGPACVADVVRVAARDQGDVAAILYPHHADQLATRHASPEGDAADDLLFQLIEGHVRVVPAVGGNDASIGSRRVVDDREHGRKIIRAARTDRHDLMTLAPARP